MYLIGLGVVGWATRLPWPSGRVLRGDEAVLKSQMGGSSPTGEFDPRPASYASNITVSINKSRYYQFIDKYIDSLRSDYQILKMDADSNYFAFSEDSIEKIIKPHMRKEYKMDRYNFLPSDSVRK